ncbi:MAG: hypothetical protein HY818_17275 [Acetobacterium woodii]|nr:hypothetical protein [Acetobacterium woodii]
MSLIELLLIIGIISAFGYDLWASTREKTYWLNKYSSTYDNIENYDTSTKLENQLFKMKRYRKSKTNDLLKDLSLLLVFIGLLTNTMMSYFSIQIKNSIYPCIFTNSLESAVDVTLVILRVVGMYIFYLIVIKISGIDMKKDAIMEIEKDCIHEALWKRKSEEMLKNIKKR